MKEAGIILLVFLMAICMTVNDAWAGAQVYITFSIGGALFIGVIGVCLQVVFQQRIAQKEEEQKQLAPAQTYAFKSKEPDSLPRPLVQSDWVPVQFDPSRENWGTVPSDLKVNFFTFRW